jgi:hypothetical protein
LTTIRRGGTLTDEDHRLLAQWAVECSEHVLPLFEAVSPDRRPREALDAGRAWIRGEMRMMDARQAAFGSNAAAREVTGAAKYAALSAGQAAAVGHVAAHDLGAAAYAIKAARASVSPSDADATARAERDWQHGRLPGAVRDLVLDDQRRRNALCWNAFFDPEESSPTGEVSSGG